MNNKNADIRIYKPVFGSGHDQLDEGIPETDDVMSVWEPSARRGQNCQPETRDVQDHYT